jgi:hypothetical protein
LLTFRVLYFESFDFASSSLIVVSSSVLDTLSNLSAVCLFPFLSSPCQKRIWQLHPYALVEFGLEHWSKCSLVNKHEEEIATLKEQVHMNNNKISELEQLNILLESDQVLTFENGRYINEVRACIMALLTESNVSMNKVNNVICSLTKI